MKRTILLLAIVLTTTQCGIYSFSGSSLPSHLKTIDLPLLANRSLEPEIADEIGQELNRQIHANNLLRIVSENGDATVSGSITSYLHEPHTFGAAATRQVAVEQYIVKVIAAIEFMDNVKNEPLFKGTITGEGVYDFQMESEADGRSRAVKDMVQRILQSSLQSW